MPVPRTVDLRIQRRERGTPAYDDEDVAAVFIVSPRISIPMAIWAYENSSPESKLRSFLAESCAASTPDVFRNLDKQIWIDANVPSELLLDTLYVYCRADKPTKKDMKLEDYFVNVD